MNIDMLTLGRIGKTGAHNFIRNAWLSTAATAVMTVTLSLVAISFIVNAALTSTIKQVVQKIDVSVYLSDSITSDQVSSLKAHLSQDPNVESIRYLSKNDALQEYRQENKNNPKLLEAISATDNPLPASLQIKTKDPNKLSTVTSVLAQPTTKPLLAAQDPVSYSGDRKATIDKIIKTSNFFKATGLVASVIFIVISTLIIFNTIRMAIFTRREEIEIMKLVGATSWFIRGPFIFEAALYGVIAAVIALTFVYFVVLSSAPKIGNYVDINAIVGYMQSHAILVILCELLLGVSIGVASSLVALKRYLAL